MQRPRKIYFVGIGGIGMSALAQYMQDMGAEVSGSDREENPVTDLLEKKGIKVAIGQRVENVPDDATTIVYSEAVAEDNPERVRAKELGLPQISYFQMLGKVSEGKRTIAVAGTHGKTTTTGMLGTILVHAEAAPTVIVGGLLKDYLGSNYVRGDSDLLVVEACEYKRDFLALAPQVLELISIIMARENGKNSSRGSMRPFLRTWGTEKWAKQSRSRIFAVFTAKLQGFS